jgi:hypothetical protein
MQAGEYHFVVTLNLGSVTVTRDGATLVLEGARREQVYNEVVDKAAADIRDRFDWILPLLASPVVLFFDMQLQ